MRRSAALLGAGIVLLVAARAAAAPDDPADDDACEENDSLETARPIEPGEYPDLVLRDLDWFRIDVAAGHTLRVGLAFSHEACDVDTRICDASGQTLASSAGVTDREEMDRRGPGTFYVEVYSYEKKATTYRLTVAVYEGDPPPSTVPRGEDEDNPVVVDDPFEENDSFDEARPLAAGRHEDLVLDDDDWFALEVPVGATLEVRVAFRHAEGDVDVQLVDANRSLVAASTGSTDEERIVQAGPGAFRLRVYGYGGATNRYDLTVRIGAAAGRP